MSNSIAATPATPAMTVGFLGLGAMGAPMALNLQHALLAAAGGGGGTGTSSTASPSALSSSSPLLVWNRSPARCAPVVAAGAVAVPAVADLARRCSLVFSMTFDDANLRAVVAEILATPDRSRSLVFVSCSTVDPEVVKEVAKSAQEGGVKFVSAPVFGRPDAAANKMLVWAVAGPADAKAVADPYFKAMGRLVIDCGEAPEKANIMKLTGNFFIASTIEILAESQTFADKNGVSPAAVMQLVSALFPSPVTVGYGTRIAQGQFTIDAQHPGFSIDGGIKDVGLMRKVAQRSGVALPVADVVARHLDRAKAIDGSDNLDWAALAKAVREESGL